MTDNDDKTAVGLTPGFYKFGVSTNNDTLNIEKLNVQVVIPEPKKEIQEKEDTKEAYCFNKDEIENSAV